jgi:hypothetical protein
MIDKLFTADNLKSGGLAIVAIIAVWGLVSISTGSLSRIEEAISRNTEGYYELSGVIRENTETTKQLILKR